MMKMDYKDATYDQKLNPRSCSLKARVLISTLTGWHVNHWPKIHETFNVHMR